MSEFYVEVVTIGPVRKHPNADTLSITDVHGGYPCIFRTGDFKEGDLATYIPVDAMVPSSHPAFAFLGTDKPLHRIKAKKLRGTFSMGLLVAPVDGDPQTAYGIEKYEPLAEREPAQNEPTRQFKATRRARQSETRRFDIAAYVLASIVSLGCSCFTFWYLTPAFLVLAVLAIRFNRNIRKKPNVPVYDIEGYRRHKDAFQLGELVTITEKIHGCNARYMHNGFKFFVGSRTQWRGGDSLWHKAAVKYDLEAKMKKHPHLVLYGEIYGAACQDLDYGVKRDDIGFAAFDVLDSRTRKYMNSSTFARFCADNEIPTVPTLFDGQWHPDHLKLAEGPTTFGKKHTREGIVVRPWIEKQHPGLGRKFLKYVGEGYLLR